MDLITLDSDIPETKSYRLSDRLDHGLVLQGLQEGQPIGKKEHKSGHPRKPGSFHRNHSPQLVTGRKLDGIILCSSLMNDY